ncbi:MAG: hypothetical protein AAGJ54_03830 [Planctomycetota bacterium]
MHIATKIFVVLAALLSTALSALTVMYAVNAEAIRSEYASAQQAADTARTSLQVQQEQHARIEESLRGELQQQRDRVAELASQINELEIRTGELRVERAKAEALAEASRSEVTQLGVATQTQANLIELLQDEVTQRRSAEVRAREQRLELEDALADLQQRNQVLTAQARSLEEQLVAAREDLTRIREGGSAIAGTNGGPVRIAQSVSGRVTQVRRDGITNATLVEVDAGSSDGLRENVRMTVFRGSQYVATITLRTVDLQTSVGEVTQTAGSNITVQSGDSVITQSNG